MKVLLNNITNAQTFCRLASGLMSEVDVISGRYVLDAKSIIGLFSLDLSKPVEIRIHEVVPSEKEQFEQALRNLGVVVD